MRVVEAMLEDIPTVLFVPDEYSPERELALWLTHLGGSAEKERPDADALRSAVDWLVAQ